MSRVLAFIPAYNCEKQIVRALAQFRGPIARHVAELIVVDNRSTDGTASAAVAALATLDDVPARVLQNDANYGLGGSHKVAFNYALDRGYSHCLVFHGDDQGRVADVLGVLEGRDLESRECFLGARFARGSQLVGYSTVRTLGNRVFNLLYSAAAGKWLSDLGSGLNLYATRALADRFYLRLPDDLTFNYGLILASCGRQWDIEFFPIQWREEDQRSNVKIVRQAWTAAGIAWRYWSDRAGFQAADHRQDRSRTYTWQVLADNAAWRTRAA